MKSTDILFPNNSPPATVMQFKIEGKKHTFVYNPDLFRRPLLGNTPVTKICWKAALACTFSKPFLDYSDSSLLFTSPIRTIELDHVVIPSVTQSVVHRPTAQHHMDVYKKCMHSGPGLEQPKQPFREEAWDLGFNKASGRCMLMLMM